MADTYVALSSLKHYDEKIKEVIDEKQDQLVGTEGQVVSFDVDGNVIAKDLENVDIDTSNFVEKEEGKGLFSGSYNDLTDKPDIPSVDGLVSEETLNATLADYVKSDDLPSSYDDTELSNRIATIETNLDNHTVKSNVPENAVFTDTVYDDTALKTELTTAIATAKQEAIDAVLGENVDADFDTLQEVATWIQSDTTGSAELVTRITTVESDIDALETSINNKVDKVSGKGLSTNDLTASLKTNYDAAYTHSTSAHAPSTAEKNVIIGIQKNGTDLTPNSSTRKVNITVPTKTSELTNDSGFKTTDTTYSNFVKSGSGAKAGLVPAPSTTAGTTKYLREDGTWQVPPDTNTTYSVVTQSAQGLMSASDKTKLDGIATGANKITVDSALNSTSTNPVQNKVVNTALTSKLSTSGGNMSENAVINMTGDGALNTAITLTDTDNVKNKTYIYPAEVSSSYLRATTQVQAPKLKIGTLDNFGMIYGTDEHGTEGLMIGDLDEGNTEYTIITNDCHMNNSLTVKSNLYIENANYLKDSSNGGTPVIQSVWSENYNISRASSADFLPNDNLNYWYVKYSNGVMMLGMTHALHGLLTYHTIYLPVSFVNNQYAVILQDNSDSVFSNGVRMAYQTPGYFSFNTQNTNYRSDDYAEGVDTISILCIGRWK